MFAFDFADTCGEEKNYTGVNGGGGLKKAETRSQDPHPRQWNFYIYSYKVNIRTSSTLLIPYLVEYKPSE
jgi:hypothetical protein